MRRASLVTWQPVRVAALILVGLGVLGFAVYKLGRSAKLFAPRYTLVAYLPDANGLREGGPVTIAGQLAGTIRSIQFLPVDTDTTRNLKVTVEIDRSLQSQVRTDSRVLLRNQGLLGDKAFDITPGTLPHPVLRDGAALAVGPSLDYEMMIRQASKTLVDVTVLTHDLRQVTDALVHGHGTMGRLLTSHDLYDRLNVMLGRTATLLARLQNPNGSVGRLLDDPTLYTAMVHAVASIDTVVTQLHSGNGTAAKLLRDDTLYDNLVRVSTRADSLVSALANANGTVSRLFTDRELYDQLVQAVAHVNTILADIQRNPKRYTKGAIKLF